MTPKIVIIGAGIVGCSLADELTERGYTDIVVLLKKASFGNLAAPHHMRLALFFKPMDHVQWRSLPARQLKNYIVFNTMARPVFSKWVALKLQLTQSAWPIFTAGPGLAISVGINARVITPEEAVEITSASRYVINCWVHCMCPMMVSPGQCRLIKLMGERSISRGAKFIAELRSDCH